MTNILHALFGKPKKETASRDLAALTRSLARPAAQLVISDAPSRSWFGGDPALPVGTSWPTYNGRRIEFIARLSLAELHAAHHVEWLPKTGALLFFYDMVENTWGFDPKDRGSVAVLHVPDLDAPARQLAGSEDVADEGGIPRRNVAFRRIEVLPSSERAGIDALDLSEEEHEHYYALVEAPFDGRAKHQVDGFPHPIQGDGMELEAQLASNGLYVGNASGYSDPRRADLEPGAADWRLLLQVDSDEEDLGVMWGDGGLLYCFVEELRARSGDFSNAWLILQCS
jgi:uncharacterized protein YwqG